MDTWHIVVIVGSIAGTIAFVLTFISFLFGISPVKNVFPTRQVWIESFWAFIVSGSFFTLLAMSSSGGAVNFLKQFYDASEAIGVVAGVLSLVLIVLFLFFGIKRMPKIANIRQDTVAFTTVSFLFGALVFGSLGGNFYAALVGAFVGLLIMPLVVGVITGCLLRAILSYFIGMLAIVGFVLAASNPDTKDLLGACIVGAFFLGNALFFATARYK